MRRFLFAWFSTIAGPAAVGWYLLFTGLAWANYPGSYGPWNNNWLSDLGNRQLNPDGAGFYALGCVGTGILVGVFFVELDVWHRSSGKVQGWLLRFVQLAGLIGSFSIVMSALFPIDQFAPHQFWSRMISGSLAVALFVSPFALRRPAHRVWPVAVVAGTGYVSVVAQFVFSASHWLEWPSIGLLLLYVLVVARATSASLEGCQSRSRPPHDQSHAGTSSRGRAIL